MLNPENIQVTSLDSDRILHVGKCLLHWVVLTPSAADRNISFYDAESAVAENLRLVIGVKSGETFAFKFPSPVPFYRGMFVDMSDAMNMSMIAFEPIIG